MTDAVNPSIGRASSPEMTKGAIQNSAPGDWILPSVETHYADLAGLSGTPLNAFDASWSDTSLTVTIDTGEAYVDGAWLGRDTTTGVTVDASTTDQRIGVGPRYQESNSLRIDLVDNFGPNEAPLPLWEVDTDAEGVTAARDIRMLGPYMHASGGRLTLDSPVDLEWSITATVPSTASAFSEAPYQIGDLTAFSEWNDRAVVYNNGNGWIFRSTPDGGTTMFEVLSDGSARFPEGPLSVQGNETVNSPQGPTVYVQSSEPTSPDENDIWIDIS